MIVFYLQLPPSPLRHHSMSRIATSIIFCAFFLDEERKKGDSHTYGKVFLIYGVGRSGTVSCQVHTNEESRGEKKKRKSK